MKHDFVVIKYIHNIGNLLFKSAFFLNRLIKFILLVLFECMY